MRKTPRFNGLQPASAHARAAARGASRKKDTKPELLLRRALWKGGLRYRKHSEALPGKPDVVFVGARVVVFCDGDFWHGRNWEERKVKLKRGNNPEYWIAKIGRNRQRDRETTARLRAAGWTVVRAWEADIKRDIDAVVERIRRAVAGEIDAAADVADSTDAMSDLPSITALKRPVARAIAAKGGTATNDEIYAFVVQALGLTREQVGKLHDEKRGKRTEVAYRIAWARTKLKDQGVISSAKRMEWSLTPEGMKWVES